MEKKIYGLIGRSLKHSYSPRIHQELGNREYRLYELEPEDLGEFFRTQPIGGLNVTIPYKLAVMEYCDALSPEAQAIGSVNTIVRRKDGTLWGHNTDAYGFSFMARRAGIAFEGKKVLVFGSGGASLTAKAVARREGSAHVLVVSRNPEGPDEISYEALKDHRDAEILVNATPVGMYPKNGQAPFSPGEFPKCCGVLDLIYNPRRTAILLEAEALGIPFSDGLPMLIAQAKAAAECFFDQEIPETENERLLNMIGKEMENIVLIGMAGCGKSTIGDLLAKMTGRKVRDLDAEIVELAGTSIEEIFKSQGEEAFRAMESRQAASAGAESGAIIITGGGVIKYERNYPALHQNGWICEIQRDVDKLPRDGRPLSQNADLKALYEERKPLYERFRDAFVENLGTPEEAAEKILKAFLQE
ncbi:MAG: shikimate kinase [Clostridiales bacterium]|nr:shikimate kinase [Clostridiales bacterium]